MSCSVIATPSRSCGCLAHTDLSITQPRQTKKTHCTSRSRPTLTIHIARLAGPSLAWVLEWLLPKYLMIKLLRHPNIGQRRGEMTPDGRKKTVHGLPNHETGSLETSKTTTSRERSFCARDGSRQRRDRATATREQNPSMRLKYLKSINTSLTQGVSPSAPRELRRRTNQDVAPPSKSCGQGSFLPRKYRPREVARITEHCWPLPMGETQTWPALFAGQPLVSALLVPPNLFECLAIKRASPLLGLPSKSPIPPQAKTRTTLEQTEAPQQTN